MSASSNNNPPETPFERARSIFESLIKSGKFICFKPETAVESKMIQEELFAMGFEWFLEKDAYLKADRIVIDPQTRKMFIHHPDETEKNKTIVKSSIFGDEFQLALAKIELGLLAERSKLLKQKINSAEKKKQKDGKINPIKEAFNNPNGSDNIRPMPAQIKRHRHRKDIIKPDKG